MPFVLPPTWPRYVICLFGGCGAFGGMNGYVPVKRGGGLAGLAGAVLAKSAKFLGTTPWSMFGMSTLPQNFDPTLTTLGFFWLL